MVDRQLRRRGIASSRVLEVLGRVPRERFVAAEYQSQAYNDQALPIEETGRRLRKLMTWIDAKEV